MHSTADEVGSVAVGENGFVYDVVVAQSISEHSRGGVEPSERGVEGSGRSVQGGERSASCRERCLKGDPRYPERVIDVNRNVHYQMAQYRTWQRGYMHPRA